MSETKRPRDPILAVCAAMQQAIERANAANLSVKKHRTILACLSLTAGRSRFSDEVYVPDVRQLTGPTEEEWLDESTVRRHLIEFGERGIFGWKTRQGTDAEGRGFPSTLTLPKVGQTGRYERPVSSAASGGGQTGRTPGDREEQTPLRREDLEQEGFSETSRGRAREEDERSLLEETDAAIERSRARRLGGAAKLSKGAYWEPGS